MENLVAPDLVISLLDRYGWSWKKTDEGNLVTGFQGLSGNFLLSFEVKEDWLIIFTVDYLSKAIADNQEKLYSGILELQAEYPYIRFAKAPDGTVFIVADVPVKNKKVDFDAFKLAMDLICEAADRFYPLLYEQTTGEKYSPPHEDET